MTNKEINEYIRSTTLSILIGERVSQLLKLDSVNNGTYFMVSRKQSNGTYESRRISYQNLMQQMTSEISSILKLSSMAFMDKDDYSKVSHDHNYNYMVCVPAYKKSDFKDPSQISCICDVSSYNGDGGVNVVSILYPPLVFPELEHPQIGEFRVFATEQKRDSDIQASINNGTFDGWVFVNGREYTKTTRYYDFSEAYKVFNGSGNKFTVPLFRDFLKLNGNRVVQDKYNKVNFHNNLKQHSHSLENMDGDSLKGKEVTVEATLKGGTGGSGTKSAKGLHLNYTKPTDYMTWISADISINGIAADQMVGYSNDIAGRDLDIETMPNHDILPGMVYIGNKKL